MAGQLIRKTRRNITDFGIAYTALKIGKGLFGIVYDCKALIIYELNFSQNYEPNKLSGIRIRTLQPHEHAYFSQIVEMEEWLENKISNRIEENGVCIIALTGDEVIGFNLIGFDWVELPLLRIRVQLKKDEAWSEQISVKKEYRKQGVANEIRKVTYDILKQKRIIKLYGHRASYNYASKMSAKKFTKNEIVSARYTKFLMREKIDFINLKNNGKIGSFSFNASKSIRAENGYLVLKANQFMNFCKQNNFTPESLTAISRI